MFVVDGTPSPLKSRARISRFYGSSFDCSSLAVVEDGVSVERNRVFQKFVQDCVVCVDFSVGLVVSLKILLMSVLVFRN